MAVSGIDGGGTTARTTSASPGGTATVAAKQRTLETANDRLDRAVAAERSAKSAMTSAESDARSARAALTTAQSKLTASQSTATSLRSRLKMLELELRDSPGDASVRALITSTKTKLADADRAAAAARTAVTGAKARISSAESRADAAERRYATAHTTVASAKRAIADAKEGLAVARRAATAASTNRALAADRREYDGAAGARTGASSTTTSTGGSSSTSSGVSKSSPKPAPKTVSSDASKLDSMSAKERADVIAAQTALPAKVAKARTAAFKDAVAQMQGRGQFGGGVYQYATEQADRAEIAIEKAHFDTYGVYIDVARKYSDAELAYAASYNSSTGDLTLTRTGDPVKVRIDQNAPESTGRSDRTIVERRDGTSKDTQKITVPRSGGDSYSQTVDVERSAVGAAKSATIAIDRTDHDAAGTVRASRSSTTLDENGLPVTESASITTTAIGPDGPRVSTYESNFSHEYTPRADGTLATSRTTGTESERGTLPDGSAASLDRTINEITTSYDVDGEVTKRHVDTTDRRGDGATVDNVSDTTYAAGRAILVDATNTTRSHSTDSATSTTTDFSQVVHTTLDNDGRPVYASDATGADVEGTLAAGTTSDIDVDTTIRSTQEQGEGKRETTTRRYHADGTSLGTLTWSDIAVDYERVTAGVVDHSWTTTFKVAGIGEDGLPYAVDNDGDAGRARAYEQLPADLRAVIDERGNWIEGTDYQLYLEQAKPAFDAAAQQNSSAGWAYEKLPASAKAVMTPAGEMIGPDGKIVRQETMYGEFNAAEARGDTAWLDRYHAYLDAIAQKQELERQGRPQRTDEVDRRDGMTFVFDQWNEWGRAVAGTGMMIVGGLAMLTGAGAPVGAAMMAGAAAMTAVEAAGYVTGQRGSGLDKVALSALGMIPVMKLGSMMMTSTAAKSLAAVARGVMPYGDDLARGAQSLGAAASRPLVGSLIEESVQNAGAMALSDGQLTPLDLVLSAGGIFIGGRRLRGAPGSDSSPTSRVDTPDVSTPGGSVADLRMVDDILGAGLRPEQRAFAQKVDLRHIFEGDAEKGLHHVSAPGVHGTAVVTPDGTPKPGRTWKADVTINGEPGSSTMFPMEWSRTDVLDAIHDVFKNGVRTESTEYPGKFKITGRHRGIDIIVIYDGAKDRIVTGYPRKPGQAFSDAPVVDPSGQTARTAPAPSTSNLDATSSAVVSRRPGMTVDDISRAFAKELEESGDVLFRRVRIDSETNTIGDLMTVTGATGRGLLVRHVDAVDATDIEVDATALVRRNPQLARGAEVVIPGEAGLWRLTGRRGADGSVIVEESTTGGAPHERSVSMDDVVSANPRLADLVRDRAANPTAAAGRVRELTRDAVAIDGVDLRPVGAGQAELFYRGVEVRIDDIDVTALSSAQVGQVRELMRRLDGMVAPQEARLTDVRLASGPSPNDAYWQAVNNDPNHQAAASAPLGGRSVTFWNGRVGEQSILDHETGHLVDFTHDDPVAALQWRAAMAADQRSSSRSSILEQRIPGSHPLLAGADGITTYGSRTHASSGTIAEDFAESFAAYVHAVRSGPIARVQEGISILGVTRAREATMRDLYPNRFQLLDERFGLGAGTSDARRGATDWALTPNGRVGWSLAGGAAGGAAIGGTLIALLQALRQRQADEQRPR